MKKQSKATIPEKHRGRPRKYTEVEVLQKKINDYFKMCDEKGKPYTITGLALALDLDRKALLEYSGKEEFSNTVKKAKARVEAYAEEYLYGSKQTAGVIFNLKNNFGWVDKTEVKADVKATIEDYFEDHTIEL